MNAEGPLKSYGVAVVGNCCDEGSRLIRSIRLHPRTNIVGAYEAEGQRRDTLARALGRPLMGSPEALFTNPAVDIVAIATEPGEKTRLVRLACEAGKHILTFPPMSNSLTSARLMVAAVNAHSVKWVQDQPQVRFNPLFARVLQRARTEPLGKVFSYYHSFGLNFSRDFEIAAKWPELLGPPRKMCGGELAHLGSQAIDFAIALFGRPLRVQADWQQEWPAYLKSNVEQFGQIILDYGGFIAVLAAGALQLDGGFNHSNTLHVVSDGVIIFVDATNGVIMRNNVPNTWEQFMKDFEPETALDQIVRCIDEDSEPDSSVEAAADGIEVLMAAYRSVLGRRAVDLPLGDGENPLEQ